MKTIANLQRRKLLKYAAVALTSTATDDHYRFL